MEEANSSYWIIYPDNEGKTKDEAQLNMALMPFLSSVCDGWIMVFKLQNSDMALPS